MQLNAHNMLAAHRRAMIVALLGVILCAAQLMAVVHAQDHAFHEADEHCLVFVNIDNQHAPVATVIAPPSVSVGTSVPSLAPQQRLQRSRKGYFERAPPHGVNRLLA